MFRDRIAEYALLPGLAFGVLAELMQDVNLALQAKGSLDVGVFDFHYFSFR